MNQIPEEPPVRPLPDPNPVTRAAHRRESFWQITVPFLIALLLVLLLAAGTIWAAAGNVSDVTRWADVSVIWLISPQLFFSLIPLIMLCGIVYALFKLLEYLPRYTRLVQDFMFLVSVRVREISDKVVEPLLQTHSKKAALDTLARKLRGLLG